jgi:hypothetical protein
MRFVAETTEAASHGTPFTADTLRVQLSGDSIGRHPGAAKFAQMRRQAMNEDPFDPSVVLGA